MGYQFRFAICNEIFQGWEFAKACELIHYLGYDGVEIAPFTLHDDPLSLSADERKAIREALGAHGLEFVGLHWLLVTPKWLHVTTPDEEIRKKSWEYVAGLVDLCADLGENGVMVFGSPKQRSIVGGISREQATRNFVEGLKWVAPHAEKRGVKILVEALPKRESDIVNTLAEAVAIVKEINSPAIQTMFDTHNTADETEPHEVLLEQYFPYIKHVHVNEMDGRHPGTGNYDFKKILRVLKEKNFDGWVSLEVFDFTSGPERIAREAIEYLRGIASELEDS